LGGNEIPLFSVVLIKKTGSSFRIRLYARASGFAEMPAEFNRAGEASEVAWQLARCFGISALYDFDWEMGSGE
jgi:hypothetical protein